MDTCLMPSPSTFRYNFTSYPSKALDSSMFAVESTPTMDEFLGKPLTLPQNFPSWTTEGGVVMREDIIDKEKSDQVNEHYTEEITKTLNNLYDTEGLCVEHHAFCNGNVSYLHSMDNKDKLREVYELRRPDDFLVPTTIKDLLGLFHDVPIQKVYSTPSMAKILMKEKMMNYKFSEEELILKESVHNFKITKERLLKAKQRCLQREEKGSDEDYLECLIKEQKTYEILTRRACDVIDK